LGIADAPAIEDVLAELAAAIKRERDRLPPDLTDRLDYYLYGETEGGGH